MDLKVAGTKRKFRLPNLRNGGKRLTTMPSYIKKEPKDGTTSESRPSNLSREIRYFSLTLVFIYLVMVSFVVSGKAPTYYCTPRITLQCNDGDIFKANGQLLKLFLEPNPQDFEEVDVLDFLKL
jgi:hypothetical protein